MKLLFQKCMIAKPIFILEGFVVYL
jgi:hypothetical protein